MADERVKTTGALGKAIVCAPKLSGAEKGTGNTLRHFLETCPDPVAEYDELGSVVAVNAAFEDGFGLSRDGMVDGTSDFVPDERVEEQREILEAVCSGKLVRGLETKRLNMFGMELDVRLSAVPICDEGGVCEGHIQFFTDITESKMLEQSLMDAQERLESLMDASPDPILVYDWSGGLSYVNPAFEQVMGWARGEVIGGDLDWVPLAAMSEDERAVEKALSGDKVQFETQRRTKSGALLDMMVSMAPLRNPEGEVHGYMEIYKDISDFKQAERRLAASEDRYRAIVEDQTEFVCRFAPDGRLTFLNAACTAGFRNHLVKDAPSDFYSHVLPEDLETVREAVGTIGPGKATITVDNRALSMEADAVRWFRWTVRCFFDEAGEINEYQAVGRDVTDRMLAEQKVRHQALHDTLTGLPNRILLMDRLSQALREAARYERNMGLLFIDLDHFKPVNDTLGHEVGDVVLKEVANRLRAVLRTMDTVARFGGDEFVIILQNVADEDGAVTVAQKCIEFIGVPIPAGEHVCNIGASIGIALFPAHGENEDDLLKAADKAMYAAKHAGKNTCVVATAC